MKTPNLSFFSVKTLPVIRQTEMTECGIACIAMVSSYLGHHLDMHTMRKKFTVSIKGATLKNLIEISKSLGLQPRPLKLDMANLKDLKLPCILHWDMNHFVVLKELHSTFAIVHDPAHGMRKLSLEEFSKHFTGVALELSPTENFKATTEVRKFKLLELMGDIRGLKRGLIQLLVMGVAMQLCALVMPFYMQWLMDEAFVAADRDLVTILGTGFLMLVVVQTLITAIRAWVITSLATSLNYQWLSNAFSHLLKLPISYFEARHLGDIVSRFSSIKTIQAALTTQFVEGLIDGLLVIATFIAMCLYSVKLSCIAVSVVILYSIMKAIFYKKYKDASVEQIINGAKQQTQFMESARGIQAIRLFGKNEERRISWTNILTDEFNAGLKVARIAISYQTINFFLFNAERVIIVWLAALAVMDGVFSAGMLMAFIAYKDQFSQRMASLIDKVFEFKMLSIHSERLADVVLSTPENDNIDVEIDPENLLPEIELKNISYRYADGEPFVLKNLNLKIPHGQCIAIAGPSGGGKTTLVKLVLGLLEPTEGAILIGGHDIRKVGLANYRKLLGVVMQNDHLFTGSVTDNIAFFDTELSQDNVEASAKMAAIHQEIMAMPMGYQTLIGDIGTGMSGGQLQRILLARALYAQPKLLVLDEATSHLDVGNEQLVNAAVKQCNMTRIIVAHRPETISMADRIVVLVGGNIVQDVMNPGQPSVQNNAP